MTTSQGYSRLHSFKNSTNFSQISTFLIVKATSLCYYLCVVPLIHSDVEKLISICIFSFVLGLMIFSAIVTGQIDPTDTVVQVYLEDKENYEEYFKGKKQSINLGNTKFCGICKSKTRVASFHCRECKRYFCDNKRCIQEVDHHCRYLNICVGKKNYSIFFITVCLTWSFLAMYISSLAYATYQIDKNVEYGTTSAEFIVGWICGSVVFLTWLAVTGLMIFHFYLIYHGMTTAQFINSTRNRIQPSKKIIPQKKQQQESNRVIKQDSDKKTKFQTPLKQSVFQKDSSFNELNQSICNRSEQKIITRKDTQFTESTKLNFSSKTTKEFLKSSQSFSNKKRIDSGLQTQNPLTKYIVKVQKQRSFQDSNSKYSQSRQQRSQTHKSQSQEAKDVNQEKIQKDSKNDKTGKSQNRQRMRQRLLKSKIFRNIIGVEDYQQAQQNPLDISCHKTQPINTVQMSRINNSNSLPFLNDLKIDNVSESLNSYAPQINNFVETRSQHIIHSQLNMSNQSESESQSKQQIQIHQTFSYQFNNDEK